MMNATELLLDNDTSVQNEEVTVVVIGRKKQLRTSSLPGRLGIADETWKAMLTRTSGGDAGASSTTWVGECKVVMGVLPEPCSRHNSPSRAWYGPGASDIGTSDPDAAGSEALQRVEESMLLLWNAVRISFWNR